MFYMSPFMLSEPSNSQQEDQQNQQFDVDLSQESCDPAKLSPPARNISSDSLNHDSYAVAFNRLTQSFLENAQVYQNAQTMHHSEFNKTNSNQQDDILQTIISDRVTSSQNISGSNEDGDYISLFYSMLSYSPIDRYRDIATSFMTTSLNAYTNHAMQSMFKNMWSNLFSDEVFQGSLYNTVSSSPFVQNTMTPFSWLSYLPTNAVYTNGLSLSAWSLPGLKQWGSPAYFASYGDMPNTMLQMWQQAFSQNVNVSLASPFKLQTAFSWFPQVRTQSLSELYISNCQAALHNIWSMLKVR